MKVRHKLIQHSKEYISVSVMLPSYWVQAQPKKFDYVDVEAFEDRVVVTPNYTKYVPKKKRKK